MDPTKNMLDYMTEMSRLFPRSVINDNLPAATMNQFFNQSMGRSSSSTDTSPESFPDVIWYRSPERHLLSPAKPSQSPAKPEYDQRPARPEQRMDFPDNRFEPFQPQPKFDTPLGVRHRPIISRKLITEHFRHDDMSNAWTEEAHSPFNVQANRRSYYELFPTEAKVQNEYTRSNYMLPNRSNIGPKTASPSYASNMSNMSQWNDTMSEVSGLSSPTFYPRSPSSSISPHSKVPSRLSFKEPIVRPSSSLSSAGSGNICTFCRKNGETPLVYTTHTVKARVDGQHIVTCPILRSHICSTCGATGDDAHTISYCPILRSTNNGKPLQSTTITLKKTRVKSNGRRRF